MQSLKAIVMRKAKNTSCTVSRRMSSGFLPVLKKGTELTVKGLKKGTEMTMSGLKKGTEITLFKV